MKTIATKISVALLLVTGLYACHTSREVEYDGPGQAMKFEFDKTKDPATGRVEREKLWPAIEYTERLKQDLRGVSTYSKGTLAGWTERGPNADTPGAAGNSRGLTPSAVASGRIRAAMVDANDATGNTVFVGGVDGGIWKTTNITANPAGWTNVNDKLANLAITGICQDPKRPDTMYFCTGEANFNGDAVQGDGIFRSVDGGANWIQLSNTTATTSGNAFNYCSKIVCDSLGNVYVGTLTGLKRSTNTGVNWTDITPAGTGASPYVGDIVVSSTGRLHVTMGLSITNTAYYRFTDSAATVTSAGWTSATTSPPGTNIDRIALACKGNNLIALPSNYTTDNVAAIYNSTNGGVTWSALVSTPTAFTSGQGWYCLAADINPSNTSQYIVGSLDCYKTTNGGTTAWTKVSNWASGALSYVHADQQQAIWYNAGAQSRVIVVCDGGLFLSTDGGSTFSDRNTGLRIRQLYACAIHPTKTNYFIAGAQDNGCNQLNTAGLGRWVEITGGDGAFVHIDQNEPRYQFGAYVFNQYRRSTDSGTTWTSVNFTANTGQFINPTDYDNTANIMYCGDIAGSYRRWTNPQSGSTNAVINITNLNSSPVFAISVSPFTANRVYFGTAAGGVVRVDNADNTASGSAGTLLGTLNTNISNIAFGGTEDTIIVVSSIYTGTQVNYTTNGTNASPTWVSKDGNLPDMPVRWALVVPGTGGKNVILATETGIWSTADITAASVTWLADPTFPNVRTDMLKLRTSDGTVAAATHARGMWTSSTQSPLALMYFTLQGSATENNISLNWTYQTVREAVKFDIERSENGIDFTKAATQNASVGNRNYTYTEARPSASGLYYRVKSYDTWGLAHYSNTIDFSAGSASGFDIRAYPNPSDGQLFINTNSLSDADLNLELYSVTGSKVYVRGAQQMLKGSQVFPLDVTHLPSGTYFLVATVNDKQYCRTIVRR